VFYSCLCTRLQSYTQCLFSCVNYLWIKSVIQCFFDFTQIKPYFTNLLCDFCLLFYCFCDNWGLLCQFLWSGNGMWNLCYFRLYKKAHLFESSKTARVYCIVSYCFNTRTLLLMLVLDFFSVFIDY
jgi:hypothetical protein